MEYEIFWDDLTDEAKERLKGLYSENDIIPLVSIILDEYEEELLL